MYVNLEEEQAGFRTIRSTWNNYFEDPGRKVLQINSQSIAGLNLKGNW